MDKMPELKHGSNH